MDKVRPKQLILFGSAARLAAARGAAAGGPVGLPCALVLGQPFAHPLFGVFQQCAGRRAEVLKQLLGVFVSELVVAACRSAVFGYLRQRAVDPLQRHLSVGGVRRRPQLVQVMDLPERFVGGHDDGLDRAFRGFLQVLAGDAPDLVLCGAVGCLQPRSGFGDQIGCLAGVPLQLRRRHLGLPSFVSQSPDRHRPRRGVHRRAGDEDH